MTWGQNDSLIWRAGTKEQVRIRGPCQFVAVVVQSLKSMHGAAENSAADTDANAAVAAFELRFAYLDVTRTPTTSHQDP